jgi:FkbM family methyltransferase
VNPILVYCRSLARRAGLTKPLARVLQLIAPSRNGYEQTFSDAISGAIRQGDVVWDIGANVGVYTRLALEHIGLDGKVVAFEPAPECARLLSHTFQDDPRVQLVGSALGASSGTITMIIENDGLATTHRITHRAGESGARVQEVTIVAGDDFHDMGNPFPAIVKIDVEGHEEQVLQGMQNTLRRTDLRDVFVEVHFELLEQRGEIMAPVRIEQMLTNCGFNVRWLDASHLHGHRQVGTVP